MSTWVRILVNWLRLPEAEASLTREDYTEGSYNPETIGVLHGLSEQEHSDLLRGTDRIDRKLRAILTSTGIYIALLVSRPAIPVYVLGVVGVLVCAGIVLAFRGWRAHPKARTVISYDRDYSDYSMDDFKREAIFSNSVENLEIQRYNELKRRMFDASFICFAISVVITIMFALLTAMDVL